METNAGLCEQPHKQWVTRLRDDNAEEHEEEGYGNNKSMHAPAMTFELLRSLGGWFISCIQCEGSIAQCLGSTPFMLSTRA